MTKLQYAVVAAALMLFLVLRFACETKAPNIKNLEKSRALTVETTDLAGLAQSTKDSISKADQALIEALEAELARQATDTARIRVDKKLSAAWFDLGKPLIAGYYAQEVAEKENSEQAWAITGTTFAIALQRIADQKMREFAAKRATKAFENAISLNPNELAHKINLALVHTDVPPADNPMKGVLMLRELNEANPNNPSILLNLGRLAIRTNQFDRAVERLEQALKADPSLVEANCLLADAYTGLGKQAEAERYAQKCQ
jgi:tetratricopeptide (TPR) repeat protein